jgi:site-specific DNA recombinase
MVVNAANRTPKKTMILISQKVAKTYNDLLISEEDYHRQKRLMELELESLIIPEVNAAQEAGRLIINLP